MTPRKIEPFIFEIITIKIPRANCRYTTFTFWCNALSGSTPSSVAHGVHSIEGCREHIVGEADLRAKADLVHGEGGSHAGRYGFEAVNSYSKQRKVTT